MRRLHQGEEGQILVQTVVLLVVLMMIAALAIDVAALYTARRRMQNAADASALAGAHNICFGATGRTIDQIHDGARAAALDYAITRNGATTANADVQNGTMGSYTVPVTVTVVATETLDMFFLRLVPGLETMNVPARAVAACGTFTKMNGFWPLVIEADEWSSKGCGDHFWISLSSCTDNPTDPNCIDCSTFDCNLDGDASNGDDIVQGGARAWIDYSNAANSGLVWFDSSMVRSGCGADELGDYMKNDVNAMVSMPVCVPGVAGANTSVKGDVTHRGPIYIPLSSSTGCTLPGSGAGCPANTFLVTDMGCAEVFEVSNKWQIQRKDRSGSRSEWLIEMRVACGSECRVEIGSTGGGVPSEGSLRSVSLIQ